MSEAAANRLLERRIMLIVWSLTVLVVVFVGTGFGGGLKRGFTENGVMPWLLIASPVIPLILWLKARALYRAGL